MARLVVPEQHVAWMELLDGEMSVRQAQNHSTYSFVDGIPPYPEEEKVMRHLVCTSVPQRRSPHEKVADAIEQGWLVVKKLVQPTDENAHKAASDSHSFDDIFA